MRMNHKLMVADDLQWKMTLRVQIYRTVVYKRVSNPKMEVYEESNKDLK
jgi:hypothetical protein